MIPVVTIGGFLGSGKTTLINQLLSNPNGRKLAVIVNDIGSVNIDDQLIQNANENKIALTNGCICCSLKSDLFHAVKQLCEESPDADAIVIEASGISNPAALVVSLKLLESTGLIRTDSVAYLIDAESYGQLDFECAENVLDNAAASDLLILNKTDIASQQQLLNLKRDLDSVALDIESIETEFAKLPLELLFSPSKHYAEDISDKSHSAEGYELHHHGFREITVESHQSVSRQAFADFASKISAFAWRAKGFVIFDENSSQRYVFNMVGKRATLEAIDIELASTVLPISLVVIGKNDQMPDSLFIISDYGV